MPEDENKEKCCPECGGTSGVQGTMTETHTMGGAWWHQPEAGESGLNVRWGLFECLDCGKKFTLRALNKKGLLAGSAR